MQDAARELLAEEATLAPVEYAAVAALGRYVE
jgi:hypothetical protein